MKNTILISLLVLVAGCGAPLTKETIGFVEDTKLVLLAKQLTGLSVEVNDQVVYENVTRSDLDRYQYGVLGAKNSKRENLQSLILKLDKGNNRIVLKEGEKEIYSEILFFTNGQTREIRIEQ